MGDQNRGRSDEQNTGFTQSLTKGLFVACFRRPVLLQAYCIQGKWRLVFEQLYQGMALPDSWFTRTCKSLIINFINTYYHGGESRCELIFILIREAFLGRKMVMVAV